MSKSKNVTIDLTLPLVDLGGTPDTVSAGRTLAEYLMSVSSSDFHALFAVAIKLIEDKPIEVTPEAHKRLIEIVEKSNMSNIMKVRMTETLYGE